MDKQLTDLLMEDSIKHHMNLFGIEGTLEKIELLYANMPVLRDNMLRVFKKIIKN